VQGAFAPRHELRALLGEQQADEDGRRVARVAARERHATRGVGHPRDVRVGQRAEGGRPEVRDGGEVVRGGPEPDAGLGGHRPVPDRLRAVAHEDPARGRHDLRPSLLAFRGRHSYKCTDIPVLPYEIR
jgi:hypothetical protein